MFHTFRGKLTERTVHCLEAASSKKKSVSQKPKKCLAKSLIIDKIIHLYIQIGDMEYIHYKRQQGSPENDGMSNFYDH